MPEPDFHGLRSDVEQATRLPEFGVVERRARWHRLRDRAAVGAAVATTLGILAPVLFAAFSARPAQLFRPDQPTTTETTAPSPSARLAPVTPAVARVRAAAAVDLDHLYVAVDVCEGSVCSLQVAPVTPVSSGSPVVIGLLRDNATDPVTDVQLVPLGPKSLMLSGTVGAKGRRYARVSVDGGAATLGTPIAPVSLSTGAQAVQLDPGGEVYAVRSDDDRITRIGAQPPPAGPVLATSVRADRGWWVVGTDRAGGGVDVSVSRDQGHNWSTAKLGIHAAGTPVLATVDGRTAYLVAQTATGGAVARTLDGGATWQLTADRIAWPAQPANARVGAVTRPDGSLLIWLAGGATPAYLESTDGARTFHDGSGPGSMIVPVVGGYLVVGQPMWVSRDARTWNALPPTTYLPPDP